MSDSRRRKHSSSSDSDSADDERKKDLQERDEFATRLRKKDESHTRKVVEVNFSDKLLIHFLHFHALVKYEPINGIYYYFL